MREASLLCFLFLACGILAGSYGPNGDENFINYHSGDGASEWNPGVPSYTYTDVQAQLTSLFVDTIGINIHGPGSGAYGPYADIIFQNIIDCGIRHLRVQTGPNDFPEAQSTIIQLGEMGFKMTMLCDAGGTPEQLAMIIKEINANFTSRGLEPVIVAAEGPNEPDNFWAICCGRDYPVTYDGQTFPEGPLLFLRDLYSAIKSDSDVSWLKVVGIATGLNDFYATNHTDMSGIVDWGNFHPYPYGGNSQSYPFNYTNVASYYWRSNFPSVNLDEWTYYLELGQQPYPGRPMMATESGYNSVSPSVSAAPDFPYVPFDVQARYTPRIFAEYFRLGIKRLLLYEACDESVVSSSNYTTVETFGIMDGTATPKPAWYAMKSLMTLITDTENPLPPYPQSNDDSFRQNLNINNVVLSYYTNITQVLNPSSNADCLSYGYYCNDYYRTYFIHHVLLQRPSTNDVFILVWHEFTAMDLNTNPPTTLPPPPVIPVEFTFTSGTGLDVANMATELNDAQYYTYDSNYDYVASNLQFTASNAFTVNVPDSIAVIQLQMRSQSTPMPTPEPTSAPSDLPTDLPMDLPTDLPTIVPPTPVPATSLPQVTYEVSVVVNGNCSAFNAEAFEAAMEAALPPGSVVIVEETSCSDGTRKRSEGESLASAVAPFSVQLSVSAPGSVTSSAVTSSTTQTFTKSGYSVVSVSAKQTTSSPTSSPDEGSTTKLAVGNAASSSHTSLFLCLIAMMWLVLLI